MTLSEIKRRFDSLVSDRTSIENTWDIIEKFIMPYRGDFFQKNPTENSVEWGNRDVYDCTAIMAAQNLASALQGSITPSSIKWFELSFEDSKLNLDLEVMRWLEQSGKACFQALQDSNFNREANETYLDIVGFGSSVIVEEAENEVDWDGLNFQSVPIRECYFEEDSKGGVYNFYRNLKYTPVQLLDKFGKEGIPKNILEMAADSGQVNTKLDIIFCIFRRKGVKNDKFPATIEQREFGSKYILVKESVQLGKEGGYYEMPAFVPRWRRTNNSKWGHSPSMFALGDVLTLNELVQLILKSLEKVVNPTTLTTERGLLSDLDLASGGVSVVRNIDDVKAYESKARFDVAELNREKLQDQINRAFYVDQFSLKQTPAMTAAEVHARMELMNRLIGPTLSRLQNDFLDPLIQRTFNILLRANQLPPIPEKLQKEVKERGIKISYVSPLYRAQLSDHIGAVQQWLTILGAMSEVPGFQDILDIPNADEIARGTGQMLGVPLVMVNSIDETKRARTQRKQAEQRQQTLQAIETLGSASKDIATAQSLAPGGIPQ